MSKTFYLIAGEASGDLIGAELIKAIKAAEKNVHFRGIGGTQMQAQGLTSLFNMQELSLMGFVEILPHIPTLNKRIKQTVADILAKPPDMLITIDSPGFTFRVVKALRKQGVRFTCVHYVAPTVWAYKPKRALKTAALFDSLLCILPFEPGYFTPHGLDATFVGHPIAWQHRTRGNGLDFRAAHHIAPDAFVLGMMPGSRAGELARHLPIFRECAALLAKQLANVHVVMPTNETIAAQLKQSVASWPTPITLVEAPSQKADALAACNLALAKSGTVALEVALAGIPQVTTFRANPLSVWLVRRLAQIPYINLMNIIAYFNSSPAPIPEMIQEKCNADALSNALLHFARSPTACEEQTSACARYFADLGMDKIRSPSELVAEKLLEQMRRGEAHAPLGAS